MTLHVAEVIQQRRVGQGMSLDELGRRSGLHRTSVGLIVRGRRGLTIETAAELAAALGTTLSELIAAAEPHVASSDI